MIEFEKNPQLLVGPSIDDPDLGQWLKRLDPGAGVEKTASGKPYWSSDPVGLELQAAAKSRRITTAYFYNEGTDGFRQYGHPLPHGLSFGMTPPDVRKSLKVPADMQSPEGDAVRYDSYTLMVEYSGNSITKISISAAV
jgi:hypothetical protein